MYPTITLRETYCNRSATLKHAPSIDAIATMKTSSGRSSGTRASNAGFTAKKLNNMNAVAFVGPRTL